MITKVQACMMAVNDFKRLFQREAKDYAASRGATILLGEVQSQGEPIVEPFSFRELLSPSIGVSHDNAEFDELFS